MEKYANIYDIDGELIHKFDDESKLTIEEADSKIKYYKEKLENTPEDDSKRSIYKTYIHNLTIYKQIQQAKLSMLQNKGNKPLEEQITSAINDLRSQLDDEESEPNTPPSEEDTELGQPLVAGEMEQPVEEHTQPINQDDMLVDRQEVDNKMDEYVSFEEIK